MENKKLGKVKNYETKKDLRGDKEAGDPVGKLQNNSKEKKLGREEEAHDLLRETTDSHEIESIVL